MNGVRRGNNRCLSPLGFYYNQIAQAIWRDYQRVGRSDRPSFLRDYVPASVPRPRPATSVPARQGRHLGQ